MRTTWKETFQEMSAGLYNAVKEGEWEEAHRVRVALDTIIDSSSNPNTTAMQASYIIENYELLRHYYTLNYDGSVLSDLILQRIKLPMQPAVPLEDPSQLYNIINESVDELTRILGGASILEFMDACFCYPRLANPTMAEFVFYNECGGNSIEPSWILELILDRICELQIPMPIWKPEYMQRMEGISDVTIHFVKAFLEALQTRLTEEGTIQSITSIEEIKNLYNSILFQMLQMDSIRKIFDPDGIGYESVWNQCTVNPEEFGPEHFIWLMHITIEFNIAPTTIDMLLYISPQEIYSTSTHEICQKIVEFRRIVMHLRQRWGNRSL